MPRCIVIADDLTGANATGVLLKKQGFHTMTLLREARHKADRLQSCDCLVLPTDSRAIPAEEAYARVREALSLLPRGEVMLYAKRIDSTLRGNLGAETDAFLDVLGQDALAVCVPVFPSSGRMLVGSHLLVNGVALRNTEAAHDPKCPIGETDALTLFSRQTKRQVAAVHLDKVQDGAEALRKEIVRLYDGGARILLVDGISTEDMQLVVDALAPLPYPLVTVDPGPFTALMLKRLASPAHRQEGSKIFCAIGSVNGVAATQALRLMDALPVAAVSLDADRLLSETTRQAEIDRVFSELIRRRDESDILALIGSGIDSTKKLNLAEWSERLGKSIEALSEKINEAFAEITLRVMAQDKRIRGLYSTGGDITAAIHRRAGTIALRLLEEVVPLAAFGQAIGGDMEFMYCISKGGMVGDENAMTTCVHYLQSQLSDHKF